MYKLLDPNDLALDVEKIQSRYLRYQFLCSVAYIAKIEPQIKLIVKWVITYRFYTIVYILNLKIKRKIVIFLVL